MALAIIEHAGSDGGQLLFRAEIGTNRFYSFVVGDAENVATSEGFRMLGDPSYSSELQGPLPPQALGRTVLRVPEEAFRQSRNPTIQLLSFRTQELSGPAASDPLRVRGPMFVPDPLTPPLFSASVNGVAQLDVVPYRAEQRELSSAMFLQALGGIVSNLLPTVTKFFSGGGGNILSSLLGGLTGGAGGGAAGGGGAAPSLQALATPENLKLIADLVQTLIGGQAAPQGQGKSLSTNGRGKAPAALALSDSPNTHFATAQWAQLIAMLPALMPMLEKVLSPETIKAVLDTADPNKLIGTISKGIQDIAKIGLEGQKQELEHLERLNPGTETPDLERLMNGMGLSRALAANIKKAAAKPADYRRIDAVTLDFADIAVQPVAGRQVAAYVAGRELAFPLAVQTPRPIRRAMLRLEVKEAGTLRLVAKRSFPVDESTSGRLAVVPHLTRDQAARLAPGVDYLVCAELVWKPKSGRPLGTSRTQLISIVGPYAFDRVEPTTTVIPLNDVTAHREFWHKAWQGSFSSERRKYVLACRYHYALDPKRPANAQMETITETEPGPNERHELGKLKSGLVLSPRVLNQLIPRISTSSPLGEEELAALGTTDFVKHFSQGARTQFNVRGREGDAAALWVYPEVKLQRIVLRRAEEVGESGQVIRFGEHAVQFPIPVLAHFVGVETQ